MSTPGGVPIEAAGDAIDRVAALLVKDKIAGEPDVSDGYLNLLGGENRSTGLGQDLMQSRFYPRIYSRWRAVGARLFQGQSLVQERLLTQRLLRLGTGESVLDVGCGTGDFTSWYGCVVGASGLAVGLDLSPTMLARAVAGPRYSNVAYLRADAMDLPFDDDTFDAACCFLAIFLMPDPMRAIAELVRVVRPDGRVALTSPMRGADRKRSPALISAIRKGQRAGAAGVVRQSDVVEILEGHGLEVESILDKGQMTYISGRKTKRR